MHVVRPIRFRQGQLELAARSRRRTHGAGVRREETARERSKQRRTMRNRTRERNFRWVRHIAESTDPKSRSESEPYQSGGAGVETRAKKRGANPCRKSPGGDLNTANKRVRPRDNRTSSPLRCQRAGRDGTLTKLRLEATREDRTRWTKRRSRRVELVPTVLLLVAPVVARSIRLVLQLETARLRTSSMVLRMSSRTTLEPNLSSRRRNRSRSFRSRSFLPHRVCGSSVIVSDSISVDRSR